LFPVAARLNVAPGGMPEALARVLVALLQQAQRPVPDALSGVVADDEARRIAQDLSQGKNTAILIGNMALSSPVASAILANAQAVARETGAKLGFLGAGANAVGGYLAGATPDKGSLSAEQMLAQG